MCRAMRSLMQAINEMDGATYATGYLGGDNYTYNPYRPLVQREPPALTRVDAGGNPAGATIHYDDPIRNEAPPGFSGYTVNELLTATAPPRANNDLMVSVDPVYFPARPINDIRNHDAPLAVRTARTIGVDGPTNLPPTLPPGVCINCGENHNALPDLFPT